MSNRIPFLLSVPERAVRTVAVVVAGTVHEAAELILPRMVRRSRLYEATAKNVLRLSIELVGGAQPTAPPNDEVEPSAKKLLFRKSAGNAVELGSIAAFGLSPLWLLAAAADVTHGTRVYLDTLVDELKHVGVLADDAHLQSVDDLLRALESTSGGTARLIDIPPLELAGLRQSLTQIKDDAATLPSPGELASLYEGLRATAERERRSVLEVSSGIGIALYKSGRHVGRKHLLDPYSEDLRPVREEGVGAYTGRVSQPYRAAVARHFDPKQETLTERGLDRVRHRT